MSATPDYMSISLAIMQMVISGKLKPGGKLPSISQLCVQFEVSPSTIKTAFIRLEALEVIIRRQGKGVYVTDPKTWLHKPGKACREFLR